MSALQMSKLSRAKLRLLMEHVFWSTLVLTTPFRLMTEDEANEFRAAGIEPTAATDMVEIIYYEPFLNTLDGDEVQFLMAHEVGHIMFKHGLRRGNRNPTKWNYACDFVINLTLKDAGMKMPSSGLYDEKYRGMSAEQVYELLPDPPPCKGGKGGRYTGDLISPRAKTEGERRHLEQEINQKVASAAMSAKLAGKVPGNIERLMGELLNPQVPWEVVLREYLTRMVQQDESWTRRNRRFSNIVLPGKYSVAMGEFVVVGDTSASMPDRVFPMTAGEINYVREQVKPEGVRVIWADDTECSREEYFEPDEPLVLHPKGFGGTDMRLALRFVERYDPCVVVLVTDCDTPWPIEPTPYPLIVVSTTRRRAPEWAETIHVKL